MASNSVTLFKDKTFNSKAATGSPMFAVNSLKNNMCIFIELPNASVAEELQKQSTEGDVMTAKLREIISKLRTNPRHENSKTRVGLIYFNPNYTINPTQVSPTLYLSEEFCDFMRDNFPKAVVNLVGTIRLDVGSGTCSYLDSNSFQACLNFEEHIKSFPLTAAFPFATTTPIHNYQYTLRSFSLSIGWEEEQWLREVATPSPNRFIQNLFKGEGDCQPKDFILVAENEAEIPCHGMILGAQSPALAAMVNPIMAMKEKVSKRIEMRMFSEEALNAFVLYIYCQLVPLAKMDCDAALELFRLGHMYQLQELAKMVGKMMLQKGELWFSPNCVLELYFLVKHINEFKPLANHAVNVMLKFNDAVRHSERYQELDKEEANELLWILLNQAACLIQATSG